MPDLEVWLAGHPRPVGTLTRATGLGIAFAYNEDYLGVPYRPPLSVRMPLSATPYSDRDARIFFDNLLPEGEPRAAVAAKHKLDQGDVYGLLAVLGAEAPGAVSIIPHGAEPVKSPGSLPEDYLRLTAKEIERMVQRAAEGRPPENYDRFSLAGGQSKFAIAMDPANHFYRPKPGVPTTHIVKVQRRGTTEQNIVANEYLCLEVFRRLGLPTVEATVRVIGGIPCLIVPRYDRVVDKQGRIQRLHQEDAAQMLGFERHLKYEHSVSGENPADRAGLPAMMRDFCASCEVPAIARDHLMRAAMLNWLLSNSDAHLKNFSVLQPGFARSMEETVRAEEPPLPSPLSRRMAPFYDLVCIGVYQDFNQELAMGIGGERVWDAVTKEHWLELAHQASLADHRRRISKRALAQVEKRALEALKDYASRIQGIIRDVAHGGIVTWQQVKGIHDVVGDRIRHLNDTMDWSISVTSDSPSAEVMGWGLPS